MSTYKNLKIWKQSLDFAVEIYKTTSQFPKNEEYGLVSQMRRSVVSIPSNIAEGAGRNSHKENLRFLYFSLGSITELETQIILCQNLEFIEGDSLLENLNNIKAKTLNYIKYVKEKL
jgi:four helix bundle protein